MLEALAFCLYINKLNTLVLVNLSKQKNRNYGYTSTKIH